MVDRRITLNLNAANPFLQQGSLAIRWTFQFSSLLASCVVFSQSLCFAQAHQTEKPFPGEILCHDKYPPPYCPSWRTGKDLAKIYPEPENAEASQWCTALEVRIARLIKNQSQWNSKFPRTECVFLLNSAGAVEDPILFPFGDFKSQKFLLATLSNVGTFPTLSPYLKNRRLRLKLAYPKAQIVVDTHQSDEDKEYFEHLRNRDHVCLDW